MVVAELGEITRVPVDRLAGDTRYTTAVAVAVAMYPEGADTAYFADAGNFPDALAIGPIAAGAAAGDGARGDLPQPPGDGPLFLVDDPLPDAVTNAVCDTLGCEEPPPPVDNAPPVAEDVTATTMVNTPVTIDLVATDPDGDDLTFDLVSPPAQGTAVITGDQVEYTPETNAVASETFTYRACDEHGLCSDPASVTVTVQQPPNPAFQRPVVNLDPGGPDDPNFQTSYTEGAGLPVAVRGGAPTITDTDSTELESLTLSLSPRPDGVAESLSVVAPPPASITASGSGTDVVTFTGPAPLADFVAALNTVGYENLDDDPDATPRVVTVVAHDGLVPSLPVTTTITIVPVNDGPAVSVPGAQTTDEDTAMTLGALNAPSVSDVDAGSSDVAVTVTSTNGTVGVGAVAAGLVVTGDGTGTLTLTGTLAEVNDALDGLTFTPAADVNGAAQLTVAIDDLGATGGGSLTDSDTIAVTITSVNDGPVNIVPGAQTTAEETALVFSTGNGNALSTSDVDAGPGQLRVTLAATNGTLTLSGTVGLVFTPPADGTDDATMTFNGDLASVNAALNGASYTPATDFTGPASVTLTVDDQGSTGISGGAGSDSDPVAVTVTGVNDGPVNTVPGTQTVDEDTDLVFSTANGNAISVADVDASPNPVQVTLTIGNGTASLSGISGLAFTAGDGTGDASMTFTGTIADVNAALAGMSFTPPTNVNGGASLTITTSDMGNTGAARPRSATSTRSIINITAVNDAPENTVPGTQAATEDTALVFNAAGGNQLSIADLDAGGATVQVTLSATNGTLTLGSTGGLTFTPPADGTADATMTFTGTIANINTAIGDLTFAPSTGFSGPAVITLTTNDLGNTGTPGAQSDTDTVTVNVTGVNDAPSNTVPGAQAGTEDTNVVFNTGQRQHDHGRGRRRRGR